MLNPTCSPKHDCKLVAAFGKVAEERKQDNDYTCMADRIVSCNTLNI